ncbi:hypothetical protein ACTWP5_11035 [Streptomyces sp. 4N509B]|uniref:hypothetical protein n=1 Tax=Streptomyces sp. 4N509B TaxID=3457413 RepID=UPI003FD15576
MSTTRRWLVRRTAGLLLLTTVTVATLLSAYVGVHRHVEPMRTQTAPAVLEVAAAMTALENAHAEAEQTLESESAALVGAGSDHRTQLSVANQSLSSAVEAGVAGEPGFRELQTAIGLIVAYTGWMDQAQLYGNDDRLREAYLFYADTTLDGILTLLAEDVQARQTAELNRQASPGLPVWAAWAVAVVLCCAFVVLVLRTQATMRRLFRRRLNPPLLAAIGLLACTLGLLVWFTGSTVNDLRDARTELQQVREPRVGVSDAASASASASASPDTSQQDVADRLDEPGWRVVLSSWIWVSGPAIGGLVLWGMVPRVVEYQHQERWLT